MPKSYETEVNFTSNQTNTKVNNKNIFTFIVVK